MKKLDHINFLYVFGIILVLLGHATLNYYDTSWGSPNIVDSNVMVIINRWIYSFHMPLFFAISGFIYGYNRLLGKYRKFSEFIISKFKRLMIPYFFVGVLYVLPTRILLEMDNFEKYFTYIFTDILLGISPAQLWYLLALFNIFLIFYFLRKIIDKHHNNIVFQISLVVISISLSYVPNVFPSPIFNVFKINNTLLYLPYFHFGYLLSRYDRLENLIFNNYILLVFLHLIIFIIHTLVPNPLTSLALKYLGISASFGIAKKLV